MYTKVIRQQKRVKAHVDRDTAKSEHLISRDEMRRRIDNYIQASRANTDGLEEAFRDDSKLELWYMAVVRLEEYRAEMEAIDRGELPPEYLD